MWLKTSLNLNLHQFIFYSITWTSFVSFVTDSVLGITESIPGTLIENLYVLNFLVIIPWDFEFSLLAPPPSSPACLSTLFSITSLFHLISLSFWCIHFSLCLLTSLLVLFSSLFLYVFLCVLYFYYPFLHFLCVPFIDSFFLFLLIFILLPLS
jgi:hypothetical protein